MTITTPSAMNRALFALLAAALLLALGYAIRHTISSFLLAFVLAYLLDPVVTYLERRKLRRVYGITFLYLVLGIVFLFCLAYIVPFLTLRWNSLIRDLPHYVQKVKEISVSWQERFQPSYVAQEWRWLLDTATGNLDAILGKVGTWAYAAAGKMAFNLLNIVLAPILAFFMLFYKKSVSEAIVSWLPHGWRDPAIELGREINDSIGGYLRGQLIVSFIVAILSTAALYVLDIDYPVFNGIFAGLASILPFVGVILATLPPLFFAFIKFQSGLMLIKVVAVFAIIYFLEGYLVKPLVFKKSMDLNPLVTIVAVMSFGELMGFWGILLAIPITAAFKIVSIHIRRGHFAVKS